MTCFYLGDEGLGIVGFPVELCAISAKVMAKKSDEGIPLQTEDYPAAWLVVLGIGC